MKKVVRDIKRGVNKKVLKVHSIEQKVLDVTSNDPWGPQGTLLADIAQASRNYHDYQKIMTVVWKRLSDTGKNWRHVFKALNVLEYLVVNGSERVIEDIREHAYHISNLSGFQYIDSTGRDQGSNVRKKSQILVALVNDNEKIKEAREKAGANRDKLRSTPGDDGYEGRYGSRDGEDQYGRDRDEYRGRRSTDGYRSDNGPQSRSSDGYREQPYEDENGHNSSRDSNARFEDGSPDVSSLESKPSGQNHGAPPSYEDAVIEGHSPDTPLPAANHHETVVTDHFAAPPPPPPATATPLPAADTPPAAADTPPAAPAVTSVNENDAFDFFDPRGTSPAAPVATSASGGAEMDLLGSLSDSFSSNALTVVPAEPHPPTNPNSTRAFLASSPSSQPFDDPFGDGPFKAVPSTNGFSAQTSATPFGESTPFGQSTPFGEPTPFGVSTPFGDSTPFGEPTPFGEAPQSVAPTTENNNMEFGDTFDQTIDILADILPLTGPASTGPSQNGFQVQPGQPSSQTTFHSQTVQPSKTDYALQQSNQISTQTVAHSQMGQPPQQTHYAPKLDQTSFPSQPNQTTFPSSFPSQFGQPTPQPSFPIQGSQSALQLGFLDQGGQSGSHHGFPAQSGPSSLQPSFPAQVGQIPLQQGFEAQGPRSVMQPGFPAQVNQSALQPSFPAQGGQSPLQPGFEAQGPLPVMQPGFPVQANQSVLQPSFPAQGGQSPLQASYLVQGGQTALPTRFPPQGGQSQLQPGFASQGGQSALQASFPSQGGHSPLQAGFPTQGSQHGFADGQNGSVGGFSSQLGAGTQAGFPNSNGQTGQQNNFHGGFQPQGSSAPVPPLSQITATPQPPRAPQYNSSSFYQPPAVTASATGALAIVPSQQPTDKKFETKSTVWADTLTRGLVNLNISGSKTNPLDDIGIDFEAINRKEKRMEKPSKTPTTSNVTMGKAMGSGSGMGRAGAGALIRPAPNPVMGSGMGINMGASGFGGINNQPMGMNGMHQNMGVGMNVGQASQMQQLPAVGFAPGSAMPPGGYNPMMGRGGGYVQQPYGGYR